MSIGAVIREDYFQSQTKVVAMIKKGTNFSASWWRSNFFCGDNDLGSELYDLYMVYINN